MADENEQYEDEREHFSAEGEEDELGEGEGGDASGKKSPKKLVLIAVAGLLFVVLLLAGLFFFGAFDNFLGKEASHTEGAKDAGAHGKGGHGDGEHGAEATAFLEIPTMIVNLNTDDGTPRYLRLSVQLELENPEQVAAVQAVIPRVIDQFQTYLRELRVSDLRGSSGIYRLQMELLWRVNQAAAPVEVKDVLFQEILIQ